MEYRGYDSAGIATVIDNYIDEKKCAGRVENLEKSLMQHKNLQKVLLGIGHVRWATHGIPNTVNQCSPTFFRRPFQLYTMVLLKTQR